MIQYEQFTLSNGLKVIIHEDHSTPMAVMNILYDVGARDENPNKTGFAHLFEHLMFGGSINIPVYDEPLQLAGGENNAYTTHDLTNYYLQLPAQNIETGFWLESDRMLSLAFSEKSLEVQRKVVCEEFKEHYINKPYGDVWKHMRALAYTKHSYNWMTIGKELSHIENATLNDVKAFFHKHYTPNNAILVVAGNITVNQIKALAQKWFEPIPSGNKYIRQLPIEPIQTAARKKEIQANVPLDALYKCWHTSSRLNQQYYTTDLITEILGDGASSRLYQRLVKEKQIFSDIHCYHFGSIDPGLLTIEGKLVKGMTLEQADKAIMQEIDILLTTGIYDRELEKVKNKIESAIEFEDMSVMNRANSLAFYELLGDASLINTELKHYQQITVQDITNTAANIFRPENCNTLYYQSIQ